MFCVFHPTNASTANCSGCNRPLCASCDHRIKGHPYCEDCIVRGVDTLRRPAAMPIVAPFVPVPRHPVLPGPSPTRATLCALVPGLGAVYNRQNFKGLVHFVATVGLISLSDATDLPFFGIGGGVFYLFTIIDANRTAKAIAAGIDPSEDEQRIKWMLAKYKPVWGMLLCAVSVLVVLSTLPGLPIGISPARMWAIILFLVGIYLIFSYFRSLREEPAPASFASPPRSVVSAMLTSDGRPMASSDYSDARATSNLHER